MEIRSSLSVYPWNPLELHVSARRTMSSEAVKTTRKVPDTKANLSKEMWQFKLSSCKLHCLSPALMDILSSSRPKNSAKYVAKGSAYSESCMSPFLDLSNFEKHGHEETRRSWKRNFWFPGSVKCLPLVMAGSWGIRFAIRLSRLWFCLGKCLDRSFQPYGNVNFRKTLNRNGEICEFENLTFPAFWEMME